MNTFHLEIVTPHGVLADTKAQSLTVRTTAGDVGVLAYHTDYAAPIDSGTVRFTEDNGNSRTGQCENGILSVRKGSARIIAEEFTWKEGH